MTDDTIADAARKLGALIGTDSPTGEAAPEPDEVPPSGDEQDLEPAADHEPASHEDVDVAAPPPIEPPASWDADDKEAFAKLDRAAQEIIHRRETARDREVRRLQNDVAGLRRGGDARAQLVASHLQHHLAHLAGLADALQSQIADEFADIATPADLARLAEQDPQRYLRFDARSKLLAQARQLRTAQHQVQREQAANERAERLQAEHTRLAEHPEARILAARTSEGETARADLRAYLTESGFTAGEVAGLEDSRAAVIAHKAMLYDRARKSIAASRQTPLPKATLKAGAASGSEPDAGMTAALVQRARRSGTVKDAGRAIARFIQ